MAPIDDHNDDEQHHETGERAASPSLGVQRDDEDSAAVRDDLGQPLTNSEESKRIAITAFAPSSLAFSISRSIA